MRWTDVRNAAKWLTEPDEAVREPYRRRRARSIAVSCLVLAGFAPLGFVVAVATGAGLWLLAVPFFALLAFAGLLPLSRSVHYQRAAAFAVAAMIALGAVAMFGSETPSHVALVLVFFSVPVGVAMGVFDVRRTAYVAGASLAVGVGFAYGAGLVQPELGVSSVVYLVLSSLLLIGGAAVLEEDRRELDRAVAAERRLFDATFEGISVHQDGLIVDANAALAEMLRVDDSALLIGRHVTDFVVSDQADEVHRGIRAGGETRYELEKLRADGTTFHAVVFARPWMCEGRPARLAAVRDVSNERREEQRLEMALESGAMALWEWSVNPPAFTMSDGLKALYGIEPGGPFDNGAEPLLGLLEPGDHEAVFAAFDNGVFGSGVFEVEFGVVTRPGRRFWSRGRAIVSAAGDVAGLIGIAIDVTERLALEERLQRAERLETVGRLAGGVAHDFNNLLTVVSGYADLVRARVPPDDPAAAWLDEIAVAGERGSRLTGQLLALGGRQVLQPVRLELNEIIEDTREVIAHLLGEGVDYVTHLGDAVPGIHVDRSQLELVLVNLALNAGDAMPTGGTLRVETSASPNGDHALLVVSDSGDGMTDDVRTHVFEPFFTTKEHGKGTGLGLASVYGVVTQSGGHVVVDSRPGEGAAFTIELPAATGEARVARPAVGHTFPEGGTGETILFVEDDDTLRRLGVTVLRDAGYDVFAARDAAEAEVVAAGMPRLDALVTDVVMPGASGLELSRRLAGNRGPLRTLFSSGYSDEVIAARGEIPAGGAFLAKPFTPSELCAAVDALLHR